MNQPFYQFTILNETTRFDFVSMGREIIHKTIVFYETDDPLFFTITLADLLPDGRLDITTKSNNGDMEKILATVFQAIERFLTVRPNVILGFKGSSGVRTRLYQIALARELEEALKRFNIWGLTDSGVEPFNKTKMYQGFFISFKNVNIE